MENETLRKAPPQRPQPEPIDLQSLLLRILSHWLIIILCAVAGAAAMGWYSYNRVTPLYRATAKLYVVNNKDSAVNMTDLSISATLAKDYLQVFDNWHVHEMVLERTGLNYSYSGVGSMISVTNPDNTRILAITATSSDPEEAQLLANTYAEVAREFINVKMETSAPSIFEEALLPTYPINNNKMQNIMLGFFAGLLIPCGLIVIRFLMDDFIRTPEDIQRAVGVPVLGTVMMQNERAIEKQRKREKKRSGGEGSK